MQSSNPNDAVRLHFCHTQSRSVSGRTEPDETLHIQIHSREQNHTLSLRNGKGKGRGGKKDEKKAKMADCTETPSKRLNRVLYWSGCRNQPPALSQALLILLFHLQSHTRKCSLPPPATTTLHSPKIRAAAHTKRDLLPWLLMMLTE